MARFVIASKFESRRCYFTGGFGVARQLGIIAPNATDDRARAFITERPDIARTLARLLTELAAVCDVPCRWVVVEIVEMEIPEQSGAEPPSRQTVAPHRLPSDAAQPGRTGAELAASARPATDGGGRDAC
jgi:hypothetical protein